MDDLVTWLSAQLDDDERVAREAEGGWIALGPDPENANSVGRHAARWDPARVLARVDADRRLLDWLDRLDRWEDSTFTLRMPDTDDARRALALHYAGRPGYREEWRPSASS